MSIYAIIMLVLVGMSFGIQMVKHGQPRENWNVWHYTLSVSISLSLMYFGGFFNKV